MTNDIDTAKWRYALALRAHSDALCAGQAEAIAGAKRRVRRTRVEYERLRESMRRGK